MGLASHNGPAQVCAKVNLCSAPAAAAQTLFYVGAQDAVDDATSARIQLELAQDALPAPQSGNLCGLCEAVVGFAESYVQQNQTEAKIASELGKLCKIAGPYQQACDNLIATYLPQIIQYIEQAETPQQVCAKIKLCSSTVAVAKPRGSGTCSICQSIVGFVEAYLEQNQTIAQIEQQLQGVCALTGPYEQICDNLVSQYVPQLIQYIEQDYTPEQACQKIGLCQAAKIVQLALAAPRGGGTCSICESIVGFVEAYLEQNQTVAQIEQQLQGVCALTGPYEQICDNLVAQYVPQLIQYIEQDYTPEQACTQIGLCSAVAVAAAPKDGGVCSICEALVGFIESYVGQNQTETQIENQLDQLCTLTGPYQQACDNLVSQYVPQLIQYVEQDYTPEQACTDIGVCSSVAFVAAPQGGGTCSICESIVGFVEAYLEQNQTVAQIEQQLQGVCALTGPYEQICDNLVAQYVPQLIQYIEQDYTPEQACTQIGLCSAVAVAAAPKDGGVCSICEALVGFIESYVGQNQTETQIENQLDQLCTLTGPYQQACDNLVSQYVPQLIQYVEQDYTPQEACTDIGVCSSVSLVATGSDQFCQVCQIGIGYLEQTYSNATTGNLTVLAEKACTALPQKYQQQCVILVDAYVPSIIQNIEQKETPLKLCTQIKLCNGNSSVAVIAPAKALVAASAGGASPAMCGLCKTIVSYVEVFLAHGTGMQVIAKQLHQLCALTQGFKAQCDALVNTELPAIIQWVTDMKTPAEICNLAGNLCDLPTPAPTPSST
jgi:saposin